MRSARRQPGGGQGQGGGSQSRQQLSAPAGAFSVTAAQGPLGLGLTSGHGDHVVIGGVQEGSAMAAAGVTVGCKLLSKSTASRPKGLTTTDVSTMLSASRRRPGASASSSLVRPTNERTIGCTPATRHQGRCVRRHGPSVHVANAADAT